MEAYDWQTGRVIWRGTPGPAACPCPLPGVAIAARPGTDDVALEVWDQVGQPDKQAALWLIPAAGTPKLLDNSVDFGVI